MTRAELYQDDFRYSLPQDPVGLPAYVAIFSDNDAMRSQIVCDLAGAGFRTEDCGNVAAILDGPVTQLGDVVMVDCPIVDAAILAALARLDMRVARSGAQLIISTSIEALDDVFAVLDQSNPQILVHPSRAERIVAVGRVMANIAQSRVQEMNEDDRLNLLHLAQQVESIAQKLEGLSHAETATKLSDSKRDWRGPGEEKAQSNPSWNRSSNPSLPDPRLVRQVIAARQSRAKFFDAALFADPAWDMLLDLTAAHAEHNQVSVTSLCIAAGVPATTALRWVKQMVESGIFVRIADEADRRRAFIALSDHSVKAMARYFAEIETPVARAA